MASKHKYLLFFLLEAMDKQVSAFVNIADRYQILALRKVVLNLLEGNLPVKEENKIFFKKHRHFLRHFGYANARVS